MFEAHTRIGGRLIDLSKVEAWHGHQPKAGRFDQNTKVYTRGGHELVLEIELGDFTKMMSDGCKAEITTLREQLRTLEKDSTHRDGVIVGYQSQLADLREKLEEANTQADKNVDDALSRCAAADNRLSNLHANFEQVKRKLAAETQRADDAEAERDRLREVPDVVAKMVKDELEEDPPTNEYQDGVALGMREASGYARWAVDKAIAARTDREADNDRKPSRFVMDVCMEGERQRREGDPPGPTDAEMLDWLEKQTFAEILRGQEDESTASWCTSFSQSQGYLKETDTLRAAIQDAMKKGQE